MFLAPFDSEFQWILSNVTSTRPVQTGAFGTSFAVNSDYISSGSLFSTSQVLYDCYGLLLCFNNYASSNAIRNGLAEITITNGSDTPRFDANIITDLVFGSSAPYGIGAGGIWYYFPIFIRAGSSVYVSLRGSAVLAFGTVAVAAWLFGAPKRPEAVRVGRYVDTFGQDEVFYRGTNIISGTTGGEGAFTQLGAATTRPYWWAQQAFTLADSSQTASVVHCDIAAGSSTTVNRLLIENQRWNVTAAEQISSMPTFNLGMSGINVPVGSNIYGRAQVNLATADTTPGMACYLLGG